ncbi:MAG: alpha-amylase family protein [Acidimicrobiia bacterium]|nr:alpha-amylase family protein [Acidimicrobiia bacterium]
MSLRATSDRWWKGAIMYCLDVETFLDWDGDGVGDLAGLTERIDYLAGLGVSVLWLMPFHPSPDLDDGYDISDFYAVDPRLGTLGEFVEVIRAAESRGMRVIIDLVVNHTSIEHPWFQASRSSRDSPYRDWYVWVDEPPAEPMEEVFPGEQGGTWTWDATAGQWYMHRFYDFQADLNVANPAVRQEIARIMGFWLQLGVSGFRVDAVPFLLEHQGIPNLGEEAGRDPHRYLKELRAFLQRRRGDAILLGEVNLPPADQRVFFGDEDGDELHLVFQFSIMQRAYLALARGDGRVLEAAFAELPEVPFDCQWATFLRNHDELTLDQLSDKERAEVFAAFGPDEDMQVYGRGLRRRLPPMLDGDQARLRLAYSLLFSLPGTPVLFYGEEIGMGEELSAHGRSAVRTPMQWSDEPGAGFSTAPEGAFPGPLVQGTFGPAAVNVAAQRDDPDSLLNWFERLIRRRRETHELALGTYRAVVTRPKSAFAHRCDWEGSTVIAVHNLGAARVDLRLPVDDLPDAVALDDLLRGGRIDVVRKRAAVDLEPYGYRWFRVVREGQRTTP